MESCSNKREGSSPFLDPVNNITLLDQAVQTLSLDPILPALQLSSDLLLLEKADHGRLACAQNAGGLFKRENRGIMFYILGDTGFHDQHRGPL